MKPRNSNLRKKLLSIILFIIFGAGHAASGPTFFTSSFSSSSETDENIHSRVEEIITSMDDTELLGQIFLFGWFGSDPSDDILKWIEEKKIGGVKVFGWNSEDLEVLSRGIAAMQRSALKTRLRIPLFIATDQEGGWVRHIKSNTSVTPGNMAIGATGLPYDAYWSGYYIGQELKTIGINMNFAPTVDVYTNTEAHVIGPRAFSEDSYKTAGLALAFYKGMDEVGVISTAKLFPGHGNATEDSHGVLPEIDTPLSVLRERELVPYRYLIREDLPAIMSGHLSFPSIIEEGLPASLSSFFLTELLKEQMGFSGIVITDDMRMHAAVHKHKSTEEACLSAFKAGNDMIMVSRDEEVHRRVWNLFYQELQEEGEFRRRLVDAVRRILKVKMKYLLREDGVPLFPDYQKVKERVPSPEAKDFFFDQACRSVSIIRDELLPIDADTGSILIVGQLRRFLRMGKQFYPQAETHAIPYSPFYYAGFSTVEEVREMAQDYDTVIFCLANPNGAQVLDGLRSIADRLIVLSSLTPSYLSEREWVRTAVAVYGTGEESALAGFASIRGMILPEGEVPFRLYPTKKGVD